jgi:chromate reductase, NAD(P)H dehydrogenase (quinone)
MPAAVVGDYAEAAVGDHLHLDVPRVRGARRRWRAGAVGRLAHVPRDRRPGSPPRAGTWQYSFVDGRVGYRCQCLCGGVRRERAYTPNAERQAEQRPSGPPLKNGVKVLLVSGSTRAMSTNTALCRTAERCAPDGVTATFYPGLAALPHFNPDDDGDPPPPAVAQLRASIADADAVLFCTPEYAGTLPGSFKNLLDWTVGGTVMTGKPVAWMRAAADPRRGEGAHATLAMVLGYVQAAVVEAACRHVPVSGAAVGPDGLVADPDIRAGISLVLTALSGAAAGCPSPPGSASGSGR